MIAVNALLILWPTWQVARVAVAIYCVIRTTHRPEEYTFLS